jgi:hypothetical protein
MAAVVDKQRRHTQYMLDKLAALQLRKDSIALVAVNVC